MTKSTPPALKNKSSTRTSIIKTSSSRKKTFHQYETPEFKLKLKESIDLHLKKMSPDFQKFNTNLPLVKLLAPCKKVRGKQGRITRPQNNFILYRKDYQEKVRHENPQATFSNISKVLAENWKKESDKIKNNNNNNMTQNCTIVDYQHQQLNLNSPDLILSPSTTELTDSSGNITIKYGDYLSDDNSIDDIFTSNNWNCDNVFNTTTATSADFANSITINDNTTTSNDKYNNKASIPVKPPRSACKLSMELVFL
ncbi:12616_t:CDS:2 [Entrophospora sp. SA101]|nr:12616_t:CDS:2 [Entrophospora sp. SA101]